MFDNFPYTDMHQLNLDWIIKIAKDFLDQYTHIQQIITDGLESLDAKTEEGLQDLATKAEELEALLQEWYNTHSEDIADQLADAIQDLNTTINTRFNNLSAAIDQKAAETLATIPADYTALSAAVAALRDSFIESAGIFGDEIFNTPAWEQGTLYGGGGYEIDSLIRVRTDYIYVPAKATFYAFPTSRYIYVYFYDIDKVYDTETDWMNTPYKYTASEDCFIRVVSANLDRTTEIIPADNNCDIVVVSAMGKAIQNNKDTNEILNLGNSQELKWVQRGLLATGELTDVRNDRVTLAFPVFIPALSFVDIILGSGENAYYYLYDTDIIMYQHSSAWHTQNTRIYVQTDSYINVVLKKNPSGNLLVNDKRTVFIITPALLNVVENVQLPDVFTFVQGGIQEDGHTTTENDARIRLAAPVPVKETNNIIINANGQLYYWYLLDANNNIIQSSGEWVSTDSVVTVPLNSFFNATIRKSNYSDILPSERTTKFIITPYKYDYQTYSGEAIQIGKHKYTIDNVLTLSSIPSWTQGSFIHGGRLFIANNNYMYAYNLSNGVLAYDFELDASPDNHSNTVFKSNRYYGANTAIPLIYVSEYYGAGRIFVNNITAQDGGGYAATKVQTINIDELSTSIVGAGYSDFALDNVGGKFYLIRYRLADTFQAESGNYTIITEFDTPSLSNANVTLTDADIKNVYIVKDLIFARQQTFFYDGKIYMTAGAGSNSHLYVIDMAKQEIVTDVDLSHVLDNKEPESAIIYQDKIWIVCNSTSYVKGLSFNT